ncbi:Elongation factor Ts [Carex littledalei]|uniref:Elongation factor Ts n=1 Tax=Carex littledalei TaxID=544730 RepID=A0A833RSD4_9POAL|nr:Elongation factor Ts [Carex littledalei]
MLRFARGAHWLLFSFFPLLQLHQEVQWRRIGYLQMSGSNDPSLQFLMKEGHRREDDSRRRQMRSYNSGIVFFNPSDLFWVLTAEELAHFLDVTPLDPNKTVLNELSKEVGSKVNIGNFMRVEIGEGIARSLIQLMELKGSSKEVMPSMCWSCDTGFGILNFWIARATSASSVHCFRAHNLEIETFLKGYETHVLTCDAGIKKIAPTMYANKH